MSDCGSRSEKVLSRSSGGSVTSDGGCESLADISASIVTASSGIRCRRLTSRGQRDVTNELASPNAIAIDGALID